MIFSLCASTAFAAGVLETQSSQYKPDNTGHNLRDTQNGLPTPEDQGESNQDLALTREIRRSLVNDASLSTNAKNIKIITINGKVTLRGPVASLTEKESIIKKTRQIAGVKNVRSDLEVSKN